MSQPLLLDEMFSDSIAQHLRAKGHDVISVVADPALASGIQLCVRDQPFLKILWC